MDNIKIQLLQALAITEDKKYIIFAQVDEGFCFGEGTQEVIEQKINQAFADLGCSSVSIVWEGLRISKVING